MKQHITIKQLSELTFEQKEKLRKWWKPSSTDLVCDGQYNLHKTGTDLDWNTDKDAYLPLLSIGQMIEFLMDYEYFEENSDLVGEPLHTVRNLNWEYDEELADALWEAVKDVPI